MKKEIINKINLIEEETLKQLEEEAKMQQATIKEIIDKADGRRFYIYKYGSKALGMEYTLFLKKRWYQAKNHGFGSVSFKCAYSE